MQEGHTLLLPQGGDLLQVTEESFCSGTIFFRSADTLVHVNGFLLRELGVQYLDSAPWACNHASLSSSDEAVLMARMADYSLILGTNRDVIIFHKFGLFYYT